MKTFSCSCQSTLFFDSVQCTSCGRLTGFCPDLLDMTGFDLTDAPNEWLHPDNNVIYRQCGNYRDHQVCNWMIPAGDNADLCRACRLNEVIPDLSLPENIKYWQKLEAAKRRALYTIIELQLPLASKLEDPVYGLTFRFMADSASGTEFGASGAATEPVFTGHDNGTITINLAEADDVARTRTRIELGEAYRTLLGHLRHEIGHYYWYRLLEHDDAALQEYRTHFGDERTDYSAALEHHYQAGPPADWNTRFISAYASMHPWEDWAECWAHYMHMLDTLETAGALGIELSGQPLAFATLAATVKQQQPPAPFSECLDEWIALSVVLNALNRSMGMPDAYPFVLDEFSRAKLQFIHKTIAKS